MIPVRGLVNEGTKRFLRPGRDIRRFQAGELTQEAAQLDIEHFWAGALRRAVIDGDVETGSVMAGQSVGMVTAEQPTAAIIAELVEQAVAALMARRRDRQTFVSPALTSGLARRAAAPGAVSGGLLERRLPSLSELVDLRGRREMVSEVCSVYVERPGDILELVATAGPEPGRPSATPGCASARASSGCAPPPRR